MSTKSLATRPFFALVGAGDLAVEFARTATADVQARFAKVDLEPKVLRDQALTAGEQARTAVTTRIDELGEDAKGARQTVESRAKEARTQLETYVNEAVAEVAETYGDLASRGENLVARIRRQQATQEAKAAARTTQAKAKTARTQTTKSAKSTTGTAKKATKSTAAAGKQTGSTAKRSTKATATSAKKTAEAGTKAASDAADKVGD